MFEDSADYNTAVGILEGIFVKPKNIIFSRHLLATRRQQPGEYLNHYLQALKALSRDCDFKAVTADQARDEYIRDAFINGLSSALIRQRLLENKILDLSTSFEQAVTLEIAQKQSVTYLQPDVVNASAFRVQAEDPVKTMHITFRGKRRIEELRFMY